MINNNKYNLDYKYDLDYITDNTNDSIIEYIYNIFESNTSYYNDYNFISIGCASNIEHKYYSILPPKDNHQIPPFLMNYIRTKNNNERINIFLIDERLSKPPYVINNMEFDDFKLINETNCYNNWFSKFNNINIYAFYNNITNYKEEYKAYNKLKKKISNKLHIKDYSGFNMDLYITR